MADEQKQSFWKSLPGILTAATGFVAALSGLVAGLSQLGAFRREQPPIAPVTATAPAPPDSTPPEPAPAATGESTSAGGSPSRAAPPSAKPLAPAVPLLAKGTVLALAVPARTCAPADGQRRFTARLAAPVKLGAATLLPAGTTAVLHIRRADSAAGPAIRLDSLVGPDLAAAVPAATVRIRRGAASAACLRADARLTVTLGAAVALRRP